jgi:hypothetical protein
MTPTEVQDLMLAFNKALIMARSGSICRVIVTAVLNPS